MITSVEDKVVCGLCKSEHIEKVKFILSNGAYQVRYQCRDCGWVSSSSLKHSPDDYLLPLLDEEAREYADEISRNKYKYEQDVKSCIKQGGSFFKQSARDRLVQVIKHTLDQKILNDDDLKIAVPFTSPIDESDWYDIKVLIRTKFGPNIYETPCSWKNMWLLYCSKCNTISVVNIDGCWDCHNCGEYVGEAGRIYDEDFFACSLDELFKDWEDYIRHGYEGYLRSEHWHNKKKEAYKVHGAYCHKCGTKKNLNVHHKTYKNIFNEDVEHDLEVLCEYCHSSEHIRQDLFS